MTTNITEFFKTLEAHIRLIDNPELVYIKVSPDYFSIRSKNWELLIEVKTKWDDDVPVKKLGFGISTCCTEVPYAETLLACAKAVEAFNFLADQ